MLFTISLLINHIFCLILTIFRFILGSHIDSQIRVVVESQTSGLSTSQEKIQKLSKWFNENIKYIENDILFNLLRLSSCGIPEEITFIIKGGRCEEWAKLYLKLLNYANISGRIVRFIEDHAFLEVMINDSWVPLEPPLGVVSYEYYKLTRNVSKAYIIEKEKIIELTKSYANTGLLIVSALYNNTPVKHSTICIYSKNLIVIDPYNYKKPILIIRNKTDEQGIFKEELGQGLYDILVFRFNFPFTCFSGIEKNYTLSPNKINEVKLKIERKDFPFCIADIINIQKTYWGCI